MSSKKRKRGDGDKYRVEQLMTFMNLPMMNYHLFRMVNHAKQTTRTILHHWSFMGVIVTNTVNRVSQHVAYNPMELVLNVCVRGQRKTFNVWGDVLDGDFLYLRLERLRNNTRVKHDDKDTPEPSRVHEYSYVLKCN